MLFGLCLWLLPDWSLLLSFNWTTNQQRPQMLASQHEASLRPLLLWYGIYTNMYIWLILGTTKIISSTLWLIASPYLLFFNILRNLFTQRPCTVHCSLLWILLHTDGSSSAQPLRSQWVDSSDRFPLFLIFFSNTIHTDTVITVIDTMNHLKLSK